MEKLKFFDLKKKKAFETSDYTIKVKGKVRIAYAIAPSGATATRILGRK